MSCEDFIPAEVNALAVAASPRRSEELPGAAETPVPRSCRTRADMATTSGDLAEVRRPVYDSAFE